LVDRRCAVGPLIASAKPQAIVRRPAEERLVGIRVRLLLAHVEQRVPRAELELEPTKHGIQNLAVDLRDLGLAAGRHGRVVEGIRTELAFVAALRETEGASQLTGA